MRPGLLVAAAVAGGCGGVTTRNADDVPELVGVWYSVQAGDTVTGIGERYGVPPEDIIELNGMVEPDRLEVGQALFLYGVDELIERLPRREARPGERPPRFRWPLARGVLSSGFGPRGGRNHEGIDIAVEAGTPVLAAAAGTVIYSDDGQRGYGNLVILRHEGDFVTVYAHNRRNLVDEGDIVRQGARIAEVGSTGRSTGPHLHFEIRVGGKAVDPLIYLPAR